MKHKDNEGYRYSKNNDHYRKRNTDIQYEDISSGNDNPNQEYVDLYSSERKKAKKKIPFGKIFGITFFLILGLIGAMLLYLYKSLTSLHYDDLSGESNISSEDTEDDDIINDNMILNVMLIGSDSMSVGDHGRSDSLMILSLDIRHKKIKVTSLMRDIWISIPGAGKDRFNAAYAIGGPKLTIDTIQKNFGIHIDRYAVVDFKGFSDIIDTLGGIDMELTATECAYINKYSGDPHTLKGSGMKHLTGLQALNYARDRNSKGSDYDRTSRQRNVIRTVLEKLKTANIAQLTKLLPEFLSMMTTNFKLSELTKLASKASTYFSYPMEEFRLPTNDNVRDAVYSQKMVLVINDMAKAKADLCKFIYETDLSSKNSSSATSSVSESSNTQTKSQKSTSSSATSSSAKTTSKSTAKVKSSTTKSSTTAPKTSSAKTNSTTSSTASDKSSTTSSTTGSKSIPSASITSQKSSN